MSLAQTIITVAIIAAGTMITRFLPFLIFPENRETPRYVAYLGRFLPAAVIGMLVVYCLKEVNIFEGSHAIPEIISIIVIVALHVWKRQILLSIGVGTVLYMLLVQLVFI